MKLESMKLEKFWLLECYIENFPTSLGTFQIKWKLSYFRLSDFLFFPTIHSNYMFPFEQNQFIFSIDIFTILRFFVISSDFMVSETLEVVYE